MRSRYDDLYDKIDPINTTKSGTRYERLVALVQKSLDETADVSHDVKLIGEDTEVKHQIDVRVTHAGQTRRVLIECKDFDVSGDPVGLGIVRDFFGVVDDVKPDEAVIITCNRFTADAMKYAKGKGIKLAILRGHTPEDDEGKITSVNVTGRISIPIDYQVQIRFADDAGLAAFSATADLDAIEYGDRGTDTYLHQPNGSRQQLLAALDELFNDPAFEDDQSLGPEAFRKTVTLVGHSVQRGLGPLAPINGFYIDYRLATQIMNFEVRAPIVALILRPVGEGTDLLIYERTLSRFQINGDTGEVIERVGVTDGSAL